MGSSRSVVARHAERDRLAELVGPSAPAPERLLPVLPAVAGLLPQGGLRRGTVVAVSGSLRLALALAAGVTRADLWAAAVGIPELGVAAAAETSVALQRLALVPDPGAQWARVAAMLLHAIDLVVVRPPSARDEPVRRRLATRARERGGVLVVLGAWPGPDLHLRVEHEPWTGLEAGYLHGPGHLRQRRARVVTTGRGSAARPREAHLWLPFQDGTVQPAG